MACSLACWPGGVEHAGPAGRNLDRFDRGRVTTWGIEHGTRRMHLGGVTARPHREWTVQQDRNLARTLDERSGTIKFLIRDRGPDFTASVTEAAWHQSVGGSGGTGAAGIGGAA